MEQKINFRRLILDKLEGCESLCSRCTICPIKSTSATKPGFRQKRNLSCRFDSWN